MYESDFTVSFYLAKFNLIHPYRPVWFVPDQGVNYINSGYLGFQTISLCAFQVKVNFILFVSVIACTILLEQNGTYEMLLYVKR